MWVFWQHDQIGWSFTDKELWNRLLTVCDAAAVRSSTASSFNKWFFVNSPWHWAPFTKQNIPKSEQSSDTIWDAIKNNLSTCSLRWDPSDICTKTRMSCLNQTQKKKIKRIKVNFLSLLLSYWWQTQARGLCQKANAHLYTVSSVDKIAAVIEFFICFWHDVTFTFSVIKCQDIKQLNARERGYSSMSCSGGSVYANVCAQVMLSCTSDPKQAVFGAWWNKCFVYNEEDVLSYEACRMF